MIWREFAVFGNARPLAKPSGDVQSSPIAEEKQASVFGGRAAESRWPQTSLRRFGESIPDWLRPRRASFRFPSLSQNATVAAFSHHCLIKAQNCGMNWVGISPFERTMLRIRAVHFGHRILRLQHHAVNGCRWRA